MKELPSDYKVYFVEFDDTLCLFKSKSLREYAWDILCMPGKNVTEKTQALFEAAEPNYALYRWLQTLKKSHKKVSVILFLGQESAIDAQRYFISRHDMTGVFNGMISRFDHGENKSKQYLVEEYIKNHHISAKDVCAIDCNEHSYISGHEYIETYTPQIIMNEIALSDK